MEQVFVNFELQKIRKAFREFYGLLPVLELSRNRNLIKEIEELENQLRNLLDVEVTP